MKKEDEFKIKGKIVNEVVDNIVNGVQELERNFIDDFGMTIDQFEKLDFYDQEKLVEKVSKYNKKKKKFLKHYPIFTKTLEKRKIKSIFKKK